MGSFNQSDDPEHRGYFCKNSLCYVVVYKEIIFGQDLNYVAMQPHG